jgi:hypothetical protein
MILRWKTWFRYEHTERHEENQEEQAVDYLIILENGGITFLRNACNRLSEYMASKPTK